MAAAFTVRLSGLDIGVESRYGFMREFCRAYLSDAPACFTVGTDDAAVNREIIAAGEPVTPEYAEALQLYREMAERLPLYDRAVFHGAAVAYGEKAYLFTGPSGVGKTTHIRLWRRFLGERVQIINGDKPILRREPSGITVWGTPYAGKEGWQRNASASLAGICFLSQGRENTAAAVTSEHTFAGLYQQVYKPKAEDAMKKTAELLRALSAVPCWKVTCDVSEEAVRTAFEALTGTKYGEK